MQSAKLVIIIITIINFINNTYSSFLNILLNDILDKQLTKSIYYWFKFLINLYQIGQQYLQFRGDN